MAEVGQSDKTEGYTLSNTLLYSVTQQARVSSLGPRYQLPHEASDAC